MTKKGARKAKSKEDKQGAARGDPPNNPENLDLLPESPVHQYHEPGGSEGSRVSPRRDAGVDPLAKQLGYVAEERRKLAAKMEKIENERESLAEKEKDTDLTEKEQKRLNRLDTEMAELRDEKRRLDQREHDLHEERMLLLQRAQAPVPQPPEVYRWPDKLHLEYPPSLVKDVGSNWEYQADNDMMQELVEGVETVHTSFTEGRREKQTCPLFLSLSGPGTGKSRLLSEVPRLCKEHEWKDSGLRKRISEAFTFLLGFENGTPYDHAYDKDIHSSIARRMIHQLDPNVDWDALCKQEVPSPMNVLRHIAGSLDREPNNLTVFLCIDGLQKLEGSESVPVHKDTVFYRTLTEVARLSQTADALVFAVCSATVTAPVCSVLKDSLQTRTYLKPASIDGSGLVTCKDHCKVFNTSIPLVELLVNDMGGHGRALEALWDVLIHFERPDVSARFNTIQERVTKRMVNRYDIGFHSVEVEHALRLAFSGKRVRRTDVVSESSEGKWTVDDICSFGLFTHDISGDCRLRCPFFLLWNLHKEHLYTMDRRWIHWELFTAQFRTLKAVVLDGEQMRYTQLHRGARFRGEDFTCRVQKLALVHADTKVAGIPPAAIKCSERVPDFVEPATRHVELRRCSDLVVNAEKAEAADWMCCISEPSSSAGDVPRVWYEMGQCKDMARSMSGSYLRDEWSKSTNSGELQPSAFLVFSTGPTIELAGLDIPSHWEGLVGAVDSGCFGDYFGPFAGRAFLNATECRPDANSDPVETLKMVHKLGPVLAGRIVENRPYDDLNDLLRKVELPKYEGDYAWLSVLTFSTPGLVAKGSQGIDHASGPPPMPSPAPHRTPSSPNQSG